MFFTVIITNTQVIFRYTTFEAAMEKFHHEMEYAYNTKTSCLCIVMDAHGATMKYEEYIAAVTPETEE